MLESGLQEVQDPSSLFMASPRHPHQGDAGELPPSGSAITLTLEGSRPLAVEIQALNVPRYGQDVPPRHRAIGVATDRYGSHL